MKNKYAVFIFNYYYPNGGWDDYLNCFESVDEAKKHVETIYNDECHIVDLEVRKLILIGLPNFPHNLKDYWKWKAPANGS